MAEKKNYKWFLDFLTADECHMHGVKSILYAKQTKYQAMEIMDTGSNGLCLVLDGKMQSAEYDEFIYHEGLVHPIMLAHPAPKNVMVIGGGEGATLREVLRHPTVEKVLMADIDQEVVVGCKKYLPMWHQGAFDDPRVRLEFIDARKYLEETKDTYDIIIIDISEPMEEGPAYLLYTKEFYQIIWDRLTPDGLISLQAGTTAEKAIGCFASVYQTLKTVFPVVQPYQAIVPSFGLPWGLMLGSKKPDPKDLSAEDVDRMIPQRVKGELRYYNGEIHTGQFMLPKNVRLAAERETRIIEDNHPLFMYT
ncbi:MAG TPA: polyamine aminopropyltransferase [Nitrospiria bacterium]